MPIEKLDGGGFIATGEAIQLVRWVSIKGMVKLEIAGLTFKGGSVTARIKKELGLRPGARKTTVLAAVEAKIKELKDAEVSER